MAGCAGGGAVNAVNTAIPSWTKLGIAADTFFCMAAVTASVTSFSTDDWAPELSGIATQTIENAIPPMATGQPIWPAAAWAIVCATMPMPLLIPITLVGLRIQACRDVRFMVSLLRYRFVSGSKDIGLAGVEVLAVRFRDDEVADRQIDNLIVMDRV